jgi:hypothetical protein
LVTAPTSFYHFVILSLVQTKLFFLPFLAAPQFCGATSICYFNILSFTPLSGASFIILTLYHFITLSFYHFNIHSAKRGKFYHFYRELRCGVEGFNILPNIAGANSNSRLQVQVYCFIILSWAKRIFITLTFYHFITNEVRLLYIKLKNNNISILYNIILSF